MMPIYAEKSCKLPSCLEKFIPIRSTQDFCSPTCRIKYHQNSTKFKPKEDKFKYYDRLYKQYFTELADYYDNFLTIDEEKYLIKKMKEEPHCSSARDRLICNLLPMAISMAKKYIPSKIPLCDLIQEANIGLIIAIDKLDGTMDNRSGTYARWWIKQRLNRLVNEKRGIITISGKTIQYRKLCMKIIKDNNIEDINNNIQLIVEKTGLSEPQVLMALTLKFHIKSLDRTKIKDNGHKSRSLLDFIKDDNYSEDNLIDLIEQRGEKIHGTSPRNIQQHQGHRV